MVLGIFQCQGVVLIGIIVWARDYCACSRFWAGCLNVVVFFSSLEDGSI